MASGKSISYIRVSTAKQGRSGLGLEAQQAAVRAFLNGGDRTLAGEFVEIESGGNNDRPQLQAALRACRVHGAKLIIAKLDRLSRNAAFLLNLRDAGVDFICADMPEANRLTIGIMAVMAEAEREAISARTIAALEAAKARGVKLGGDRGNLNAEVRAKGQAGSLEARREKAQKQAADLAPTIAEIKEKGIISANGIAKELNARGITTARGKLWTAVQVQTLLARV